MSGLKLDNSKLRIKKVETKPNRVPKLTQYRKAQNRLHEKTKPSDMLFDKVRPSEKLLLEKTLENKTEKPLTKKKIPAYLRKYQYKPDVAKKFDLKKNPEIFQGFSSSYFGSPLEQGDMSKLLGSTVDSTTVEEVVKGDFGEDSAIDVPLNHSKENESTEKISEKERDKHSDLNHSILASVGNLPNVGSPINHLPVYTALYYTPVNSDVNQETVDLAVNLTLEQVQISSIEQQLQASSIVQQLQASSIEKQLQADIQATHSITTHSTDKLLNTSNLRFESLFQTENLRPHQNMLQIDDNSTNSVKSLTQRNKNFHFQKQQQEQILEYSKSNTLSKWQQKQNIKKSYVSKYKPKNNLYKVAGKSNNEYVIKETANLIERFKEAMLTIFRSVATRSNVIIFLLIACLIMGMTSAMISISTMFLQGIISAAFTTTSSSYTATEDDLLEVEANYKDLEQELQDKIDNIETDMSGYDEYIYNLSEIGHDPHELAALLTALYHAYTPSQVESKLDEIFSRQYSLTTVATVETRTRIITNPDGTTSTETYQWKILTITLTNTNIHSFAMELLTDDEYEHYLVLRETKGHHPDLFGDYLGGGGAVGDVDFVIPDHYLDDDDFARVYAEAIKYLGYPYTWGGQSPTTSFDCSGFMYWIYNSTGVYSHSRLTAGGYYNICTKFDKDQRQAGDLIFFTGTSSHATISHVGMYVGDGMMIHSASAGVSFAPVDTGYWAGSAYVCYGRLPI